MGADGSLRDAELAGDLGVGAPGVWNYDLDALRASMFDRLHKMLTPSRAEATLSRDMIGGREKPDVWHSKILDYAFFEPFNLTTGPIVPRPAMDRQMTDRIRGTVGRCTRE